MDKSARASSRKTRPSAMDLESQTLQETQSITDRSDRTPIVTPATSESDDKQVSPESRDLLDIDDDPFSTEISKILFESIDELRKNGASQDLDLPQLVIVGKQSAGKSSLLQSLTDIPFPIGDGLCTQFATRIVSKRTAPGEPSIIKATIEAGDVNPFPYLDDYGRATAFSRTFSSMTVHSFKTLIDEAKEVMGISEGRQTDAKVFSSLVLKIELSGPERSHFGILDIPGIYSNRRDLTSRAQAEMEGVKQMVISYMQKRENIVILVADALDDLDNQAIFDLAADHVDSSRAVGVWTKCDITPKAERVVRHVQDGTGIPGRSLRWYVVQNGVSRDDTSFDREEAEKATFSKGPWLQIPDQRRGTPMLKRFLANLLSRRIRESFPEMQDTVERLLQAERMRRKVLGDPRTKPDLRRNFLRGIIKEFQDLANKALFSPGDLPSDDTKLRGMIVKQNERFATSLSIDGVYYKFLDINAPIEFPLEDSSTVGSAYQGNALTLAASPKERSDGLYHEIYNQMKNNRGVELPGMLNPAVLRPLWKIQTSKWQSFGEQHVEDIISLSRTVSLKLLDLATSNKKMTARAKSKLEAIINRFSEEGRTRARNDIEALCTKNATMVMQTTDAKFNRMVREAREQRFFQALGRFRDTHPTQAFISQLPRNKDSKGPTEAELAEVYQRWIFIHEHHVRDLFNEIHPQGSRSQNVQDEIHDILKSYYELEIELFTAHVIKDIGEVFLKSPQGPLFGLSTDYIDNLTEEEVDELGGEDDVIVASRDACDSKIRRLEEATKIAERALRETREKLDRDLAVE